MIKILKTAMLFTCAFAAAMAVTAEKAYAGRKSSLASENISNKEISDSLVEKLSCRKLSIDGIYSRIKADAFDESRNMPIKNWPFRSGVAMIAGCWGLSSTQRMVSYLARYNESSSQHIDKQIPALLDQVRGGTLESIAVDRDRNNEQLMTRKLKVFKVFPVEGQSLAQDWWHTNSLWNNLMRGYQQNLGQQKVDRHFRAEIEANQARHFFRAGNLGMAAGDGARSAKDNQESAATMRRNADSKRLTLVNLRADRTAQHIVMVKSYSVSKDIITFKVYDSNAPEKDWELKYSTTRSVFYAPEIIGRFVMRNEYRDLGVYVVDEDEREDLEEAMMAHYRVKCR